MYIICIYCICVDRLMTCIAFQVANWFVFRMQQLWTLFPSDCLDCMDLLEYVGNVWKCCLFASFKVTHPHLTQCRASLFKPQNRYTKYGFLNCLCQYAIFCSWFSFFVCTYGDTGMRLKESKGVTPWHGWGSEGPFDVILGFSEGASCAAVLMAAIQGVSRILEPRNHTTTKQHKLCPSHTCVIWLVWKILLGIHDLNCEAWKKH